MQAKFHLGIIWVKKEGFDGDATAVAVAVAVALLVDSLNCVLLEFVAFGTLLFLNKKEPPTTPGGVNSFSFSFMGFDSISTTCDMEGLRPADACVQKSPTLINLKTCSSGYSCSAGSITSLILPSTKSCQVCACTVHKLYDMQRLKRIQGTSKLLYQGKKQRLKSGERKKTYYK